MSYTIGAGAGVDVHVDTSPGRRFVRLRVEAHDMQDGTAWLKPSEARLIANALNWIATEMDPPQPAAQVEQTEGHAHAEI